MTSHSSDKDRDPLFEERAPTSSGPREKYGDYKVVREIARGGMGNIYLAREERTGVEVALKVLRRKSDKLVQRFMREAQILARLDHTNIIQILDYGLEEDQPYMVMKYIEGTDLKEVLKAGGGKIPLETALQIILIIARAVDFAHNNGIIHRDLKPGNILLQENRPLLTDFGIARAEDNSAITTSHQAVGSPSYMSPEQMNGLEIDHRTDIYSLGVILFNLLTGRKPFEGSTYELFYQVTNQAPPKLTQIDPEIPLEVEEICETCLAKSPEDRYQTAEELALSIERIFSGECQLTMVAPENWEEETGQVELPPGTSTTLAAIEAIDEPISEPSSSSSSSSSHLVVVVLILILAGGGGWYFSQQPQNKGLSLGEEEEGLNREIQSNESEGHYENHLEKMRLAWKEKKWDQALEWVQKAVNIERGGEGANWLWRIQTRRHLERARQAEEGEKWDQAYRHYHLARLYCRGEGEGEKLGRTKMRDLQWKLVKVKEGKNTKTSRFRATWSYLSDGRILIVGGQSRGRILNTAEIYDPATGEFSTTGSMNFPRAGHTQTLLADGKVLIVGGLANISPAKYAQTSEIYDPGTGEFTPAGDLKIARAEHCATVLPTGLVLITGGYTTMRFKRNGTYKAMIMYVGTTEIFDPPSGCFVLVYGDMKQARYGHRAVLLPDKKVLVLGGGLLANEKTPYLEYFEIDKRTFVKGGKGLNLEGGYTSTLLPSGDVVITGGTDKKRTAVYDHIYLFHSKSGEIKREKKLPRPRRYHRSTLLPWGELLLSGGQERIRVKEGKKQIKRISNLSTYRPVTRSFVSVGKTPHPQYAHIAFYGTDHKLVIATGHPQGKVAKLDFRPAHPPRLAPVIDRIFHKGKGTSSLFFGDRFVLSGSWGRARRDHGDLPPPSPRLHLMKLAPNFPHQTVLVPRRVTEKHLEYQLPAGDGTPRGRYIMWLEEGGIYSQGKIISLNSRSQAPPGFVYLGKQTFICGREKETVELYRHDSTGIEFVKVPPPPSGKAFLMSRREITYQQWVQIMGNQNTVVNQMTLLTRSRKVPLTHNTPAAFVSFGDAQKYCEMLGFSLPTEVQWKHAYRGGSKAKFFWGDEMDTDYLWCRKSGYPNRRVSYQPVGTRPPNAYGLCDMAGNVWEWTADQFIRGGSYFDRPSDQGGKVFTVEGHADQRAKLKTRSSNVGLRVVYNLPR